MSVNQQFYYTGSSTFSFNNVSISENEIGLFDSKTGIGGVDYMPGDGDTVTVVAGAPSVNNSSPDTFEPSLNNKIYYLVTDVEYSPTDYDTIIAASTEIPVVWVTDHYEGTFKFTNPNEYEYLYIFWDYSSDMDMGSISFSGADTNRVVSVDFGTDIGRAGVSYATTAGVARYLLRWNGVVVGDTGYIGLNSTTNYNDLIAAGVAAEDIKLQTPLDGLVDNGTGTIEFSKYLETGEGYLSISAPLSTSEFSATRIDPSLTSFYIDSATGTLANVCSQVSDELVYHDGSALLPVAGNRIYTAADGSVAFDGGNSYHMISETLLVSPPVSGGIYALINSSGTVLEVFSCDCTEYAPPVIFQDDISFKTGDQVRIKMQATGNPTSWDIDSSCISYSLDGGSDGTIFQYTPCGGSAENIVVSSNEAKVVCSTSVPTVVTGDGSVTVGEKCFENELPAGLSFDTSSGYLFGTVNDSCDFTIILTATNCVGDSVAKSVGITVSTGRKITPFAIDVENFGDTGDAACSVDPVYSILSSGCKRYCLF
jgi:hypothetical protein